jgi:DNA-binding NarL/FixJ family response regulator
VTPQPGPAPVPRPVRVALVDDQRLFSDALTTRLTREPDVEVVGAARSGTELLVLVARRPVDVVLLEVDLAGEDGPALVEQVRAAAPHVGLVAVTSSQDDRRMVSVVRAGVTSWVPKEGSVDDLLRAVRGAARSESWFPPPVLFRLLRGLTEHQPAPSDDAVLLASLTSREAEVLRCLAEGATRAEMAARLGLSTNTVRTHVQHVLHKLGVHSSLSAVAIAQRASGDDRQHTGTPPQGVVALTPGTDSRVAPRP